MRICDLTYAYNEVSGGIRTYIDAKRAYIRDHTDWEHVLIIPGEEDRVERDGRLTTYRIKSPILPGSAPYRLIVRLGNVKAALRESRPDLIELGSLYTLPWTAFSYRKEHPVAIVGYYHTDFADVYVQPAAEKLLGQTVGNAARTAALRYTQALYRRCDATVTASPALETKLRGELGLANVTMIPLGVDLDTFNPNHRDADIRRRFGATSDDHLMLIYAGRFDLEKRVLNIAEGFRALPDSVNASLVLVGQGPLEERLRAMALETDGMYVQPFEKSKAALARLYASADLYLGANPHETFGLSIVEAQASGLAVIGVRSGAMIERIPDDTGWLITPDSAPAFTDALTHAANIDLVPYRQAARAHVEAHFGWNATFGKLCTLYAQIHEQRLAQIQPVGSAE